MEKDVGMRRIGEHIRRNTRDVKAASRTVTATNGTHNT